MFSFKRSLIAFIGQLALIVTIVALVPLVSRGQGKEAPPPFNVKVINSPSEPVPVTGTVSVSNLGGAPLPVRDVDNPARQLLQVTILDPFNLDPVFFTVFTVPAGKRLVIENVSAEIEATPTCVTSPRYALKTTAGGTTLEHFFYPQNTGTLDVVNGPTRAYGLSQQTRIYADPNTQVTLKIRVTSFPSCGYRTESTTGLRVSGYLVDVP